MSTSFLVIQAQRDLAQAKTNELAAVLAYDLVAGRFRGAAAGGAGSAPRRRPLVAAIAPRRPGDSSRGLSSASTPRPMEKQGSHGPMYHAKPAMSAGAADQYDHPS